MILSLFTGSGAQNKDSIQRGKVIFSLDVKRSGPEAFEFSSGVELNYAWNRTIIASGTHLPCVKREILHKHTKIVVVF